jgi:hypothetical protein
MVSPLSPAPHFRIGDRVLLIYPLDNLAAGSIGTVVSRFIGGSVCIVQFDRQIDARVVDGEALALVPPEPSRRR